jgi:hypothetical protein
MVPLLLSLYPKPWRDQYAKEYQIYLEDVLQDSRLTASIIFDIVKTACWLRFTMHAKNLHALTATALYTLSGVMCIQFGLTENWPIWLPTNLLQTIGLVITLTPLAYALYIRFLMVHERKRHWQGNSVLFWLVSSSVTILSTLLLALICSCLLLSTGFFAVKGGAPFVSKIVSMAAMSLGIITLLNMLQGVILRQPAR